MNPGHGFMRLLRTEVLGDSQTICLISDRHAGIIMLQLNKSKGSILLYIDGACDILPLISGISRGRQRFVTW
jgi:hypothetical protein